MEKVNEKVPANTERKSWQAENRNFKTGNLAYWRKQCQTKFSLDYFFFVKQNLCYIAKFSSLLSAENFFPILKFRIRSKTWFTGINDRQSAETIRCELNT